MTTTREQAIEAALRRSTDALEEWLVGAPDMSDAEIIEESRAALALPPSPAAPVAAGKHTPGPWQRVVSRGQSAAYTRVGAGDYGAVAECSGCRPSQDENAANARLIAAAPDMLAALQMVSGRIDHSSGSPSFTAAEHDSLVMLLARATGREG